MSSGTWLLRDGEVLANAEVADSVAERAKGLLGKTFYEGAFVLPHTKSVHSLGMRFTIDVAFVDREMRVFAVVCLAPWRMTRPRPRCRMVIEAQAGAFERWGLRVGDQLELRDPR